MLALTGCRHEDASPPALGDLTAFTVTELLGIRCTGIWTVDGQGTLRWLAGVADPSRESPTFPAFQHDGRLTVGFGKQPNREGALPLIDIFSVDEGKRLALDVLFISFMWSPGRSQLLALVAKPKRKNLSLVRIEPDAESVTTVAESAGSSFSWLGDGNSVAYLAIENEKQSLWVADAAGSEARLLARNVARFAASSDGKLIAFRRRANQDFGEELWVVEVETGRKRRLPGAPLPDRSWDDVWVGTKTLVVHEKFPGAGVDEDDAILIDIASGARTLLASDIEVLEAARDGSRLLAIRQHQIGSDLQEGVIAVLTMRADGTGERLLAVTDADSAISPVSPSCNRSRTISRPSQGSSLRHVASSSAAVGG